MFMKMFGFSLIEMLLGIVLLSVLAMVVVPKFDGILSGSYIKEAEAVKSELEAKIRLVHTKAVIAGKVQGSQYLRLNGKLINLKDGYPTLVSKKFHKKRVEHAESAEHIVSLLESFYENRDDQCEDLYKEDRTRFRRCRKIFVNKNCMVVVGFRPKHKREPYSIKIRDRNNSMRCPSKT